MNFLEEHKKFKTRAGEPQAFDYIRGRGLKYLNEHGWPTRKDESWKYTAVKPILDRNYSMVDLPSGVFVRSTNVAQHKRAGMTNLVFVNGQKNSVLSDKELPQGVEILTLREGLEKNLFNSESLAQIGDNFEALSLAFFDIGLVVRIKDDVVIEKPLHLIFVSENQDGRATPAIQPRIVFLLGRRSKAILIETYIGEATSSYFVNVSTELYLSDSANLSYGRLQEDGAMATHIGRTRAILKAGSNFNSLVANLGSSLGRHELAVIFEGQGASAKVLGAYSVNKAQHVDNQTLIEFRVGDSTCEQIYKGVLSGESRAIFNGRVIIHPDAQKVNSSQLNNNLLLSDKAEVDTKPQLEIFADDVKATHGATVGQLNEDELFYLVSRAIPPLRARQLLTAGFLTDLAYQWDDGEGQAYFIDRIEQVSERQRHEES